MPKLKLTKLHLIYTINILYKYRGTKVKKLINFKRMQLVRDIQDYANEHYEGNFTLAVVRLCKIGINASKKSK